MILELIKSRRAVFPVQYNGDSISKEELDLILECANWAPTHRRTEPWRFKVFYSEISRKNLSDFLSKKYTDVTPNFSKVKYQKIIDKPLQSGCVIAICFQRDPKESVPEWEEIAATSMAVQNMWLAAHELGIGSYWSSHGMKDYLTEHIPLGASERCLGFFYMGKYDGPLQEGIRASTIGEKTTWY